MRESHKGLSIQCVLTSVVNDIHYTVIPRKFLLLREIIIVGWPSVLLSKPQEKLDPKVAIHRIKCSMIVTRRIIFVKPSIILFLSSIKANFNRGLFHFHFNTSIILNE